MISALAGFGFAVGFTVLGMGVASLSRAGILVVVSGGIIASRALIHGLLSLRPESLLLLPVVFALAAKLLLEPPPAPPAPPEAADNPAQGDRSGAPESAAMPAPPGLTGRRAWRPIYAVYALTGLSHGLYYSLLAVMEPLLPRPKPHLLLIVVLSCLISPLCIHLARRASLWRTILLMGPLLVVGYTAWPLLHRESPALSLDSLHFAYTLLGVYSYTTLFYAASWLNARRRGNGIRLIGFGGGHAASQPAAGHIRPARHPRQPFPRHHGQLPFRPAGRHHSAFQFRLRLPAGADGILGGRAAGRPTRPHPAPAGRVLARDPDRDSGAGLAGGTGGRPASAGGPESGRLRTAFPPARADPPAGLHRGHAGPGSAMTPISAPA